MKKDTPISEMADGSDETNPESRDYHGKTVHWMENDEDVAGGSTSGNKGVAVEESRSYTQ